MTRSEKITVGGGGGQKQKETLSLTPCLKTRRALGTALVQLSFSGKRNYWTISFIFEPVIFNYLPKSLGQPNLCSHIVVKEEEGTIGHEGVFAWQYQWKPGH